MSPDGGGEPEGELKAAIDDRSGGVDRGAEGRRQRRRRQALRQRLDVARLRRHRARRQVDAEPGQPAARQRRAAPRHRRLGARLLPQLPEPASRLPRGVVERRQLGRGGAPLRGGRQGGAVARRRVPPHRRHREARRRRRGRLRGEGWEVFAAGSRDGDVARAGRGAGARGAGGGGARRPRRRRQRRVGGLRAEAFEEVTEADVDAALGATVKGSFFVTQAAAPYLRASRGLVVMLEDVAAYLPWPSFAAHCAAKAAQAMLTRALARALAPEVRVCGVAPGPVAVEPEQEERGARRDRARDGSATRTTSPRRSSISQAPASSPARPSSSTEAGCCKPARPAMRRPSAWMRP